MVDEIRNQKSVELVKAASMQALCAVMFLDLMKRYPVTRRMALSEFSAALTKAAVILESTGKDIGR